MGPCLSRQAFDSLVYIRASHLKGENLKKARQAWKHWSDVLGDDYQPCEARISEADLIASVIRSSTPDCPTPANWSVLSNPDRRLHPPQSTVQTAQCVCTAVVHAQTLPGTPEAGTSVRDWLQEGVDSATMLLSHTHAIRNRSKARK